MTATITATCKQRLWKKASSWCQSAQETEIGHAHQGDQACKQHHSLAVCLFARAAACCLHLGGGWASQESGRHDVSAAWLGRLPAHSIAQLDQLSLCNQCENQTAAPHEPAGIVPTPKGQ